MDDCHQHRKLIYKSKPFDSGCPDSGVGALPSSIPLAALVFDSSGPEKRIILFSPAFQHLTLHSTNLLKATDNV